MLQFKSAPKITTDRLLIRIVSEEDAKDFYEFCSDPLVCEYLTFNPYKSLFHTKTIINNMINAYIHGTDVNFSVVLKDTLKVIGSVSLNFKSKENFTEIGYLFNSSYWNKGYAYEAVEAVIKVAFEYYNVELIIEPYSPNDYLSYVSGLENEPEKGRRCVKCIELRLLKAAEKARDIGINFFTTSLSISPHKNFNMINEIGQNAGNKYGVKFLPYDFKKKDGFLKTNKISKGLNLYRQNYCGCKFAK